MRGGKDHMTALREGDLSPKERTQFSPFHLILNNANTVQINFHEVQIATRKNHAINQFQEKPPRSH